jgi:hypothetical protein
LVNYKRVSCFCQAKIFFAVNFANAIRSVAHSRFKGLREDALEKFSFDRMAARSLDVYSEFSSGGGK